MNICKKLIAAAVAVLPLATFAQTDINFEDETKYTAVGVYDWWEDSPFRTDPSLGNCAVVTNPDANLEDCANPSPKVLGFQRSIHGSNMYGARIDLPAAQRFELTPTVKYVHILMKKPADARSGRSMLIGLGKHNSNTTGYANTWANQELCEQFTAVSKNKATVGQWTDVVFPVKGAGNIDIHSLVVVPDCEDPSSLTEDFIVYLDDVKVNTSSAPTVALVGDYPLCFEKDQAYSKTDRKLNSLTVTTALGEFTKQGNTKMYTEAFDSFIPVKAGETVQVQMSYTGNWMHSFYYLDKNRNGKFEVLDTEATELVTASYGDDNAHSSAFGHKQSFTIPADLVPGIYRLRGKVDWMSTDPAGNDGSSGANFIVDNRGAVIDVLFNVYDPNANVTVNNIQRNGDIVLADGSDINNLLHPSVTTLKVKAKPENGFDYAGMILHVGYGEEPDAHGNPQSYTVEVPWQDFDKDDCYTIPATYFTAPVIVEGDMREAGTINKGTDVVLYEGLKISPAPANGRFDKATVWYTLANWQTNGKRYISTGSSYMSDGFFVTNQATKDETDAGLWCIVSDGNGAYMFYNRATGTSKVLGTNVSDDKSAMVDATSTTNTLFTFNERTAGGGIWNIKNGTSGNNYWCGSNDNLGHWASNQATTDNNCRWVFEETEVTEPIAPEVTYFSDPEGPYTYWGLKFNSGDYYISETDDNALLKTTGTAATSWALVGTKESFVLRSSTGKYVGINSNKRCISVANAEDATEFAFFNEDTETGTFMIVRKGQTETGFNPWGGNATGNPIGFWDTSDANDKLVFVEVEQPVIDTPSPREDIVPAVAGYKMLDAITNPAQLEDGTYFLSVNCKNLEGLLYGNSDLNVSNSTATVGETFDVAYVWTVAHDDNGNFTLTNRQGQTISATGKQGEGKGNLQYTTDANAYAFFTLDEETVNISDVPHWMVHQQKNMAGSENIAYLHCNGNPSLGTTSNDLHLSFWGSRSTDVNDTQTCDKIAFYPAKAVYDKEATIYNLVHVVELAQDDDADLDDIEITVNAILEK